MARSIIHAPIGPGRSIVAVRLPKGERTLSSGRVQSALNNMTQRISNAKSCTVVFFKKPGGGLVATQRCDGRHLKAHNRKQCRAKATKGSKNYKRFVRCR